MNAWPSTRLDELVTKVGSGATPRGGKRSYKDFGIPLIRSMNVHFSGFERDGLAFIDESQAKQLDNVLVRAGDVLLNITGASIGRVTMAPPDMDGARVNQHVCIVRPKEAINPSFLRWFFASPNQQRRIERIQKGVTRPALTKQQILDWEVPVPNRETQNEVVAKIEELFSDLDAGVAALERARANLKRYRASVLKAAVEGKLTEQWRAEHPDVEPASALLERILAERRKKWEEAQDAKAKSSNGRARRNNYDEPVLKLPTSLTGLPHQWAWTTLDVLTHFTIDYRGKTPPTAPDGIPIISAANVKAGRIVVDKPRFVSEATYRQWTVRGLPNSGDLIVTTEAPVGEVALYPDDRAYLLTRRVFACQTNGVDNRFLMYAMAGRFPQAHIRSKLRGTTVPRILKPDLLSTPIPLPPLEEQKLVADEIERHLTIAHAVMEVVKQTNARSKRLRRAILKRAFEGRLFSEDRSIHDANHSENQEARNPEPSIIV